MNKREAWTWEETRRVGRLNYVFRYGVLRWGLWMVLMMSVYDYLQGRLPTSPAELLRFFAGLIIAFMLVGGSLSGLWTWSDNERRYRKSQTNPTEAPVG